MSMIGEGEGQHRWRDAGAHTFTIGYREFPALSKLWLTNTDQLAAAFAACQHRRSCP